MLPTATLTTFAIFSGVMFAAGIKQPQPPLFHRDVEPILQAQCQSCHRPGEAGPMPLLTYTQARPWARAIRESVVARGMPPWFSNDAPGRFKNDPRLSVSERETLIRWAETGAGEGSPSDAPPPRHFAEGWNIGVPDQVFGMAAPFAAPAAGVLDYQNIVIPSNFTEDRWIQAVEIRPGNRAVVHHAVNRLRTPGTRWLAEAVPGVPLSANSPKGQPNDFFAAFAPGIVATRLPEGRAILVKAGTDFVLQLHYTINGRDATDQTTFGLIYAKEPPAEEQKMLTFFNAKGWTIPAGASDYAVEGTAVMPADVRLVAIQPHMHLRGKAFDLRLVNDDGTRESLLAVPRYDFQWQLNYELAAEMALAKGARIEFTCRFDNSVNNPSNPDPSKEHPLGRAELGRDGGRRTHCANARARRKIG